MEGLVSLAKLYAHPSCRGEHCIYIQLRLARLSNIPPAKCNLKTPKMEIPVVFLPWLWGFESKALNSVRKWMFVWPGTLPGQNDWVFSWNATWIVCRWPPFRPSEKFLWESPGKQAVCFPGEVIFPWEGWFFGRLITEGVRSWNWQTNGRIFPLKRGLMRFVYRHPSQ